MGNKDSRFPYATLHIEFEGESRAFDSEHPIVGSVRIISQQTIAAYSIIMKLVCIDMSKKTDRNDKGAPYYHTKKLRSYEAIQTVAEFENTLIPIGETTYPFTFNVPQDA